MSALKQVVSEQNEANDKLFISAYLDVFSKEYEQPNDDQKQVNALVRMLIWAV